MNVLENNNYFNQKNEELNELKLVVVQELEALNKLKEIVEQESKNLRKELKSSRYLKLKTLINSKKETELRKRIKDFSNLKDEFLKREIEFYKKTEKLLEQQTKFWNENIESANKLIVEIYDKNDYVSENIENFKQENYDLYQEHKENELLTNKMTYKNELLQRRVEYLKSSNELEQLELE